MKPIIAIVGPTAVGKSDMALSLAQTFGSEIVNADSHQVYRHMDIGTAKPGLEDRRAIPHHLIDIVDPDEAFSLALYQSLAYKAIDDIQERDKIPLLAGGSGLYVWSVIEGWQIPQVPPDIEFRREMEQRAAKEGIHSLYQQLQKTDPVAASRINPHNVRRVIRALEVCQVTGSPFSQLQRRVSPGFNTILIGLTAVRDELYRRIDQRVDDMIKLGFVEEVKSLLDRGYGFELPAISSVGYKQIGRFINGELDLPAAIQQTKFETHRLARHQYAWFRLNDPRIRWFDIQGQVEENVLQFVEQEMQLLR